MSTNNIANWTPDTFWREGQIVRNEDFTYRGINILQLFIQKTEGEKFNSTILVSEN